MKRRNFIWYNQRRPAQFQEGDGASCVLLREMFQNAQFCAFLQHSQPTNETHNFPEPAIKATLAYVDLMARNEGIESL